MAVVADPAAAVEAVGAAAAVAMVVAVVVVVAGIGERRWTSAGSVPLPCSFQTSSVERGTAHWTHPTIPTRTNTKFSRRGPQGIRAWQLRGRYIGDEVTALSRQRGRAGNPPAHLATCRRPSVDGPVSALVGVRAAGSGDQLAESVRIAVILERRVTRMRSDQAPGMLDRTPMLFRSPRDFAP
jgi:hypothetical protein